MIWCMFGMYVVNVCFICMFYMYVLNVCFKCMFWMYVLMHVLMHVLMSVFAFVWMEVLITEMAPLLSVDVSIPFQLRSCIHVLCCLLCAWVRKPAFTGVLSYKTAACFNLDQCATLNLTFSIGVLRLKCRCWNGSLTVPNTKNMTRHDKNMKHTKDYTVTNCGGWYFEN